MFAFHVGPLTKAGEWAVVVEYTEQRPQLCKALTKLGAVLRSTASTFQVTCLDTILRTLTSSSMPAHQSPHMWQLCPSSEHEQDCLL